MASSLGGVFDVNVAKKIQTMRQVTLNLDLDAKKTQKCEFLKQIQPWFRLSDPAMEEAFFDPPLYREFAQLVEFPKLSDERVDNLAL